MQIKKKTLHGAKLILNQNTFLPISISEITKNLQNVAHKTFSAEKITKFHCCNGVKSFIVSEVIVFEFNSNKFISKNEPTKYLSLFILKLYWSKLILLSLMKFVLLSLEYRN